MSERIGAEIEMAIQKVVGVWYTRSSAQPSFRRQEEAQDVGRGSAVVAQGLETQTPGVSPRSEVCQ